LTSAKTARDPNSRVNKSRKKVELLNGTTTRRYYRHTENT
jgi:hypothetical protein